MIEIIPNESRKTLVDKMEHQITNEEHKLPRNFRQIGNPDGKVKVYLEDYVYTYLHQQEHPDGEYRMCILVGQIVSIAAFSVYLVSGGFVLQDVAYSQGVPILTEQNRERICEKIKTYFDGKILLGWYLDRLGIAPSLSPELERVHKHFFGGRNKIMLLNNSLDRDESLYVDEAAATRRYGGYYVYYERNEQMQEYMITSRLSETAAQIEPEKVGDEALKNYREIVIRKEEQKAHKKNALLYFSSGLMVFAFCVVGICMMNNYQQMEQISNTIASLSDGGGGDAGEYAVMKLNTENSAVMQQPGTETAVIEASETTEANTQGKEQGQVTVTTANSNLQPLDSEEMQEQSEKTDTAQNTADQKVEENQNADEGQAADIDENAQENQPAEDQDEPETEAVKQLTEAETIQLQGYYIVQKGENLATISNKIYGSTDHMQALIEANGIEDSDKIYAGEKLILP